MKTSAAAVRPYTSYNLFFQLEREYILQTALGFQPKIAPDDVFNPNDQANYGGPPLPPRYENLILPYDWHIPGKTQRRKRSHRKSHGKIGFHELNEQISKAWSLVDQETQNFCVVLAEIEGKKYKTIKKMTDQERKRVPKKQDDKKNSSLGKVGKNESCVDFKDLVASFDWTDNYTQGVTASPDDVDVPFIKIDRVVSQQSLHTEHPGVSSRAQSRHNSFTEVDMKDDEIMALWEAAPIDRDTPSINFGRQVSTELPPLIPLTAIKKSEKQLDTARLLFVEAQYEKFKEIGMKFSSKPKFQGFKINAFAACQA